MTATLDDIGRHRTDIVRCRPMSCAVQWTPLKLCIFVVRWQSTGSCVHLRRQATRIFWTPLMNRFTLVDVMMLWPIACFFWFIYCMLNALKAVWLINFYWCVKMFIARPHAKLRRAHNNSVFKSNKYLLPLVTLFVRHCLNFMSYRPNYSTMVAPPATMHCRFFLN